MAFDQPVDGLAALFDREGVRDAEGVEAVQPAS
jgi:hypothetical protein